MATKNKYTDIDLSKYDNGYQASQEVLNAQQNKVNAENAVANYGDFNYKNQAAYDKALDSITNRPKFSYDLNADALYQQYKDNYIMQGKQAMMDTMGQAAAMTGGYGNSYAATVGNQTYNAYLTQLNNIAPELYKLALDKYNAEGTDLMNQFNILQADRQTAYGEWGDTYNRLVAERNYQSNEYDAAYSRDYSAWNDNRTYDTSQYWNEYNTGYQAEQDELTRQYQAERDAIADAQWQKEFEEAQRQYNQDYALQQQQFAYQKQQDAAAAAKAAANAGKPKTPTAQMYDEALKAYNSGGQKSLEQYADKHPEYDYEALFDYATRYGYYKEPTYVNVIGKTNYRTSGNRDAFDSGVRSAYANRNK
jgi:hypothetical protein